MKKKKLKNPFFSIVTVVKNDETNIKNTIKSILSQNYKNFELFCLSVTPGGCALHNKPQSWWRHRMLQWSSVTINRCRYEQKWNIPARCSGTAVACPGTMTVLDQHVCFSKEMQPTQYAFDSNWTTMQSQFKSMRRNLHESRMSVFWGDYHPNGWL